MARVWGVEGGRLPGDIGDFDPDGHKGIDVWCDPGSEVYVPVETTLQILEATYDPGLKAQARGWIVLAGKRYGWVCAHLAEKPALGHYGPGQLIGRSAQVIIMNGTRRTPHVHIALNPDRWPPPGTVDPVGPWRRAVRRAARRAAE